MLCFMLLFQDSAGLQFKDHSSLHYDVREVLSDLFPAKPNRDWNFTLELDA